MAKLVADAEPMADARLAGGQLDDAACSGKTKTGTHADAEVDDGDLETQFASDLFDRRRWLGTAQRLRSCSAALRQTPFAPSAAQRGPRPALVLKVTHASTTSTT